MGYDDNMGFGGAYYPIVAGGADGLALFVDEGPAKDPYWGARTTIRFASGQEQEGYRRARIDVQILARRNRWIEEENRGQTQLLCRIVAEGKRAPVACGDLGLFALTAKGLRARDLDAWLRRHLPRPAWSRPVGIGMGAPVEGARGSHVPFALAAAAGPDLPPPAEEISRLAAEWRAEWPEPERAPRSRESHPEGRPLPPIAGREPGDEGEGTGERLPF